MQRDRTGFTLIELLVTIAIVTVLTTIAVLTLNPVEIFKQTRDAKRVVDMSELGRALGIINLRGTGTNFGNSSTTYISIPDLNATTTEGTDCAGLGLPVLSPNTNWKYHCAASSTFTNTDGTGWLPVNFRSISEYQVIPVLPIDPANTLSSGFYYAYINNNGQNLVITTRLESQKFLKSPAMTDGGVDPTRYEITVDQKPWSNAIGLINYLSFDSITGGKIPDISKSGNSGTPK